MSGCQNWCLASRRPLIVSCKYCTCLQYVMSLTKCFGSVHNWMRKIWTILQDKDWRFWLMKIQAAYQLSQRNLQRFDADLCLTLGYPWAVIVSIDVELFHEARRAFWRPLMKLWNFIRMILLASFLVVVCLECMCMWWIAYIYFPTGKAGFAQDECCAGVLFEEPDSNDAVSKQWVN